jgi:hypothetical protein
MQKGEMDVGEWFDEMRRQYLAAIPWPWPRSMTDDEMKFWMSAWPNLKPTEGVFIGGEARVKAVYPGTINYFITSIDLDSAKFG